MRIILLSLRPSASRWAGKPQKADAEEIVRRVKHGRMEDFWQEKKEEEYHERTLQGAYAQ